MPESWYSVVTTILVGVLIVGTMFYLSGQNSSQISSLSSRNADIQDEVASLQTNFGQELSSIGQQVSALEQRTLTAVTVTNTVIEVETTTYVSTVSATANVQIVTETCPVQAGNNTCALSWTNTGSAPASADSCSIYGGAAVLGIVAGTPATVPLAAGSHGVMYCQYTDAGTETAGTSLTGQVVLSNGATLTFNSVWT